MRAAVGFYTQTTENYNVIPPAHLEPRERWAIQICLVDSLRWREWNRVANILGRHSVEHSFTRMAKIWCGPDDKPLKDPNTGKFYDPIFIGGWLNPGIHSVRYEVR